MRMRMKNETHLAEKCHGEELEKTEMISFIP